ncbi:MAG: sterol desaturase family protein [Bacteroidetes bacterium]|nr:sterol desaturase family protein [Bacteroidota bacterium]
MTKEFILLAISVPVYTVFISLELYLNFIGRKNRYLLSESLMSGWFALLGFLFDLAIKFLIVGIFYWANQHALFKPELLNTNPILAWIIVFFAQDFCFYWLHRTEHTSRFFWAAHSNHHSAEKYNFTVALRSSVFQPFYRFLFYLPIAFLGFDYMTIMFMYAINQCYQFFLHTEMIGKLPRWIEFVFATPSHHRVHHASDVKYLDKNMGQVLILWDKLFGTFQEEEETPTYGLTKPLNTNNLFKAVVSEHLNILNDLKRPVSLKQKLFYIFKAPGWSHDGSTKTSEQLREELNLRN